MLFVNNDRTCSQVPTLGLPALTGPQQALAPQASLQTALQQQLAASAALGENNMFLHISVYIVKWFFSFFHTPPKTYMASRPTSRWLREADRSRWEPRDEQPPLLSLLLAKLQLGRSYGRRAQWGSPSSPTGGFPRSVLRKITCDTWKITCVDTCDTCVNPQLVQSQAGVTGGGLQQYTVTSPLMSQASTTQVNMMSSLMMLEAWTTNASIELKIILSFPPSQAAAAQGQLAGSSPAGIPTLDSSGQGFSLLPSFQNFRSASPHRIHEIDRHNDPTDQGTNMGSHPGMVPGVSPYPAGYSLANIPGVDWSALGYSLPAMYTL